MRAAMFRAAARADLVELRLDYLDLLPAAPAMAELIRNRPCPVIITNRPMALGGHKDTPNEVRLCSLQTAIDLGADYVDIEIESSGLIRRGQRTKLIVSYHNFLCTPLDLSAIFTRIVQAGADIAKIATKANSIVDNLRVLDVVRRATIPCIGLCMGEPGTISRILGRKFGSLLTYAPLDPAKATAPGQLSLDEIVGLYNYRSINSDTQIYGVVSNPITHSISPEVHNAAFRSLGINAVYVPFKVEEDVCSFFEAFRELPVHGYSITIPHKEAAMSAMDEVEPICRDIGAVNTVVNRKGRLVGSNTDWSAATQAIESALGGEGLAGKRVALIGAGGTARAIAFGLRAKGANTCIYNRTPARAARLATDVGCRWATLDALPTAEFDILINSTSVGMHPKTEESPAPTNVLRKGVVVFDAVYNPVWTRLLCDAKEAGCRVVSGLAMFVNQAVQQFRTWTGLEAPRELMEAVARERLVAKV